MRPYFRRRAVGEKESLLVRLSSSFVNTVAFLAIEEETRPGVREVVPKATAFFVLVEQDGQAVPYVVTARHCIEETKGREFFVRFNSAEGIANEPTNEREWFCHDDADVAAAVFSSAKSFSLTGLGLEHFVRADYTVDPAPILGPNFSTFELEVATGNTTPTNLVPVGVGTDVAFVGLFIQHPGAEKNLPVVRFGHISQMPSEPIHFDRGEHLPPEEQVAYLAECRSWGGHSGSPVFSVQPVVHLVDVDAPPTIETPTRKVTVQTPDYTVSALLGLVSGHFDISQKAKTSGDVLGEITSAINSGMAIITPAEAIRELLTKEDVVKDREKRVSTPRQQGSEATFDSGFAGDSESEFERFEDLTRKLVNTPKSEIDENRKGES